MTTNIPVTPPAFHFKQAGQATAIITLLVLLVASLFSFVFIDRLTQPRIDQLISQGSSQAVLVSDMALSEMYAQKQVRFQESLQKLHLETIEENAQFVQISVIVHPTGLYYGSTEKDFYNLTAHESLQAVLAAHNGEQTQINKINYSHKGSTLPVFQFLRNINVEKPDQTVKVATTQILISYQSILTETKREIITYSAVIWLIMIVLIWSLIFPVSQVQGQVIDGLRETGKKNFTHQLPKNRSDEMGLLLEAYNHMNTELKAQFLETKSAGYNKAKPRVATEVTSRKSDLTCMCLRFPELQNQIDTEATEKVTELIHATMTQVESAAAENGGQVVKIIGDKVYVLFEGINCINNSIRSAIKLRDLWKEENHERKVLNKEQRDYGIGLHAASGIAGTVDQVVRQYTFLGEAASLADYLCSCAHESQILISSSMLDKASGSFRHQEAGEISPVNLPEHEEIFVLTESSAAQEVSRKIAQDRNPEQPNVQIQRLVQPVNPDQEGENSITNMLEETLSEAPLDTELPPIGDMEFEELPSDPKQLLGQQGTNDEVGSSLWDGYHESGKPEEGE